MDFSWLRGSEDYGRLGEQGHREEYPQSLRLGLGWTAT